MTRSPLHLKREMNSKLSLTEEQLEDINREQLMIKAPIREKKYVQLKREDTGDGP